MFKYNNINFHFYEYCAIFSVCGIFLSISILFTIPSLLVNGICFGPRHNFCWSHNLFFFSIFFWFTMQQPATCSWFICFACLFAVCVLRSKSTHRHTYTHAHRGRQTHICIPQRVSHISLCASLKTFALCAQFGFFVAFCFSIYIFRPHSSLHTHIHIC